MTVLKHSAWQAVFALSLLLCVLVSGAVKLRYDHHDTRKWVEHTHIVLNALSEVFGTLSEMEAGQRGFLLTLNDTYLVPYDAKRGRLPDKLDHLRRLVSDNPEQSSRAERIAGLAHAKAGELANTIALALHAGREQALAIVRTDAGQQFMQAFRVLVSEMAEAERLLLSERQLRGERTEMQVMVAISLIGLLALVGIVGSGVQLAGEARRSREQFEGERRLRQELKAAKEAAESATAAKSHFMRTVQHDLRQPLTVITMAHAALSRHAPDPRAARYLEWIGSALGHISGQLDELSEVSRLEAGIREARLEEVALQQVLDELCARFEPIAAGKGVRLRCVPSGVRVRTDPHMLRRLVENLVGNAVKYTEPGGSVLIGCRRRRHGHAVALQVLDTGCGIPAEKLTAAFEPYQQLNSAAPGQGLGLWIVQQTATLLGHAVDAASVVGRGSRFSVELPTITVGVGDHAAERRRQGSRSGADPANPAEQGLLVV